MKFPNYIAVFALRILRREWPKYALAFLSLFVTSVTFTVVLVSVDGARAYLTERSREFLGGDLVFETGMPTDVRPFLGALEAQVVAADVETELVLAVRSGRGVTSASARAITDAFPLYGTVELEAGTYAFPAPDEVYAERVILDRLGLSPGGTLFVGAVPFTIRGVIAREPDAVVQGFRFAPRLILSQAGLERAAVPIGESRSEFEYRFRFGAAPEREMLEAALERATAAGAEARVAGRGEGGVLRRLALVERFFLITVLIGAVLSAVNVYANVLSLVARLRKSFAVFLVEGATKRAIVTLVLLIVGVITLTATVAGIILGSLLLVLAFDWIGNTLGVTLESTLAPLSLLSILLATLATSLAASLPSVRDLLALEPRDLLAGTATERPVWRSGLALLGMSLGAFLPLFSLAVLFLERLDRALFVIGGTLAVFVIVALLFRTALGLLSRVRARLPFFLRAIVAEKVQDGVFGIVAVASLLIALASLFSLALLERSLERSFASGLASDLPSAYIIDVQPDQTAFVEATVPGVTLFPNVRARILRIDERLVQERLRSGEGDEDRELRREFNLTYRDRLLASEQLVAGEWSAERRGEVSVEETFAERAGIQLGSTIEFFIQGIQLEARVTSLRSAETTNGLPFFYFLFAPAELARFPASFFGYADLSGASLRSAEAVLAERTPNITVIDTSAVTATVREVTATALTLLAVITLPPLLLATLLLVSLVATTFAVRQRDALRLQVLGATRTFTTRLYLIETAVTVLSAGAGAYVFAMAIVAALAAWTLDGIEPVFVDWRILEIIFGLLAAIILYGGGLLVVRRRTLRQALAYEENT
jgi:putative ABC transport system permease protein